MKKFALLIFLCLFVSTAYGADKTGITQFLTPGGNGTMDVEIAGFGQPDAVIFFWGSATSGTTTDDLNIGMGACQSSVSQWAISVWSDDGLATSDTSRGNWVNRCIDIGDGGAEVVGVFNAWSTNGVQVNFTTTTSQMYVTALFIQCDNAFVGYTVISSANEITEYNPGFEPDFLVMGTVGDTVLNRSGGHALFSSGFATNDLDQVSQAFGDVTASGTMAVYGQYHSNKIVSQAYTSLTWEAEITEFNASGFKIDADNNPGGDYVFYIAVNFASLSTKTGTYGTPTGADADADGPSLGFEPDAVCLITGMHDTIDSWESADLPGAYGYSVFSDAASNDEFCHSVSTEDAVTTSNTASLSDNQALRQMNQIQVQEFIATKNAMEADNWSLGFSTANGTERKWGYLAIGKSAPPAAGPSGAPTQVIINVTQFIDDATYAMGVIDA